MSELGPEARALIDGADGVDSPSPRDKENVRAKLAAHLGVAAVGAVALAAGKSGAGVKVGGTLFGGAGGLLAAKVFVAIALGTAVTAVVVTRSRHEHEAHVMTVPSISNGGNGVGAVVTAAQSEAPDDTSVPPSVSPARAAAVPPQARPHIASAPAHASAPAEAPAASAAPAAALLPSTVSSAPVERDGEVALFTKAKAAIDAGNGAAALELLERHERLYPGGVLANQRAAQRVLALCAVGRVPASREAAERFLAERPRSSDAARVRRACGVP